MRLDNSSVSETLAMAAMAPRNVAATSGLIDPLPAAQITRSDFSPSVLALENPGMTTRGDSERGKGLTRSRHMRSAAASPSRAIDTAFDTSSSRCGSSNCRTFSTPGFRPDGLPDWPGCHAPVLVFFFSVMLSQQSHRAYLDRQTRRVRYRRPG